MKQQLNRRLNLITGAIATALIVVLIGVLVYALIPRAGFDTTGRRYVAYFEDASGLEAGDAVRIKGRRAGVVQSVSLAMRDGRPVNRVEFTINPGTGSTWLREERIATDSRIEVAVPRLFRRPQLVISPGSAEGEIPEGGEWTNARGGDGRDEIEAVKDVVDQMAEMTTRFEAFLDEPEGMQKVQETMARIRTGLEQADEAAKSAMGQTGKAGSGLDQLLSSLESLSAAMAGANESLGTGADRASRSAVSAEEGIEKARAQISRVLEAATQLEQASESNRHNLEQAGLGKVGTELRRFAARVRASMEIAHADPSKFGDLPNWRNSRRYFNGDHPLPESATAKSGD